VWGRRRQFTCWVSKRNPQAHRAGGIRSGRCNLTCNVQVSDCRAPAPLGWLLTSGKRFSDGWLLLWPGALSRGSCLRPPPGRPLLGLLRDPATQHVSPWLSKPPGLQHTAYHLKELTDDGVVGWGFCRLLIIVFIEYECHRSFFF